MRTQVEVRLQDSGALAHRDNLSCPISAILTGNYQGNDKQDLIVCGQQGEVSVCGGEGGWMCVCVCVCVQACVRQSHAQVRGSTHKIPN